MNPFIFAVVLPTLLIAHNLADHVIQTDHQAARKATSWRAMAGHVGGYTLTSVAFLAVVWFALDVRPDWRWALAGLAFSAVTHAFLDLRWPVRWILDRTGSRDFARPLVRTRGDVREVTGAAPTVDGYGQLPLHGPYLADQACHWVCLFIAALLMSAGAA